MEYELNILDRIVLIQILAAAPTVGNYLYHEEFTRVAGEVSIPQIEQNSIDWEIDDEQGGIKWDGEKAQVKTVEIPGCIERIVVNGLKRLDKEEQLRPEHIPVYKKFVLPWDEREAAAEDDAPAQDDNV